MRCIDFALCTLHCYCAARQWCSAKRRRVERLADEPALRSIMERQGGWTTIVDELESNLRAKLHMDGLIKSKRPKLDRLDNDLKLEYYGKGSVAFSFVEKNTAKILLFKRRTT